MENHMPEPDPAMFVGPFGKMVNELDQYTEGSRVGVLVSLLAGFSAAIGKLPGVNTGKGHMPLSFWPVLVGPTGIGRKGTATGIAMEVIKSGLAQFAEHQILYTLPATGLGFVTDLHERSIRDEAVPLLFVEEEMDNFIWNAKADRRIGPAFRKVWDGAQVTHKTSKVDLVVKHPHVAIIGHVQPKNWAAISGSKDASGGTYNRFFPVWVWQSKKLPVFGRKNPEETIKKLGNRLRGMVNYAQEVPDLTVPDDVAEVFETKHREICDALTTGNEELGQYTERAMAYMIRIAGLYALGDKRTEIRVEDFDAALALVDYMTKTVTYVLPEAEASGSDVAARIIAFVREAGPEGRTSTEITKKFQRVRAAEIQAVLESAPEIKKTRLLPQGGRPATLYQWIGEEVEDLDDELDDAELIPA